MMEHVRSADAMSTFTVTVKGISRYNIDPTQSISQVNIEYNISLPLKRAYDLRNAHNLMENLQLS